MKVTDKIYGIAHHLLFSEGESLREALRVALADVPEPALTLAEHAMGHAFYADMKRAEQRADAAEAKLAEVRKWHAKYGLPQEGGDELEAILEGKPVNEQSLALLRMLHLELVKAAADRNSFMFAPEYVPLLAAAVGATLAHAPAEAKLAKIVAHAKEHGSVHVDVVLDIADVEASPPNSNAATT